MVRAERAIAVKVVGARRATAGLVLGLAAAAALLSLLAWPAAFVGSTVEQLAAQRGEAVVRRARTLVTQKRIMKNSPFYSNADRERQARFRREDREEKRQLRITPKVQPTLNYDNLPSVEDLYSRVFTGNSTIDPIGGRKRMTYYVQFKHDPQNFGPQLLKKSIIDYIWFLKYKMSCRNIEASTMLSPVDGLSNITTLEYPMKEYGEWDMRSGKSRPQWSKCIMVKFDMMAPVTAGEYIGKKFYGDNNILRTTVLSHTRTYRHKGEDNELHL